MGRFWDAATEQAGREFGARHYRWFAGARLIRPVAAALSAVAAITGLLMAGFWVVDHSGPAWRTVTAWAPTIGTWAAWLIGSVAVVAGVIFAVVYVRRNRWRWYGTSTLPTWFRRY